MLLYPNQMFAFINELLSSGTAETAKAGCTAVSIYSDDQHDCSSATTATRSFTPSSALQIGTYSALIGDQALYCSSKLSKLPIRSHVHDMPCRHILSHRVDLHCCMLVMVTASILG